ncbi:DUF2283 domain-containing protein [Pseudolysinimonas sp.]
MPRPSFDLDSRYDHESDAGYVAFDRVAAGEAVRQVVVDAPGLDGLNRAVILDFDAQDRLLGIELLGVSELVASPRISQ